MKNEFQHLEHQTIRSIKRIDLEENYEFYRPLSICLELESGVLKLSTINDGISLDIRITNWEAIREDDGLVFGEYFLQNLNKEDSLGDLIGERIKKLEIAKPKQEVIEGTNWISYNGRYAGVRIETDEHLMIYYNQFCSVDLLDDFPDKSWIVE